MLETVKRSPAVSKFALIKRSKPVFLIGILFAISACATNEIDTRETGSLLPGSNDSGEQASARSLSSMEAISRGIAAVTPPGSALKDVYYEFDSPSLGSEAEETLKQNAHWMKANPTFRVEIEGHCDDIGSAEYNLALGARRAQVAKDFLLTQGIGAERLVTISYGKEAPACFDPTEECRVKNRRARFVVFTELPTS
jgi:peptidoglycan-associated lipoprotein